MKTTAMVGLVALGLGLIPALMLFSSHIALAVFSEESIQSTQSTIQMMHVDRLYLAPAFIAVISYFIATVLAMLDLVICKGKSARIMMSFAIFSITILFLIGAGAACMATILRLPLLLTPIATRMAALFIIDFVGIVMMGVFYLIFLCSWFSTLRECDDD